MIANYEFTAHPQDIKLLQYAAAVATMAHAPFIAAASPKFFGEDDITDAAQSQGPEVDLRGADSTPSGVPSANRRTRGTSGLSCPDSYSGSPTARRRCRSRSSTTTSRSTGSHDKYLWGNAVFTFATRLTDSFAKFRWCPEHHRPAERRRGRGPAGPRLQGDGRDRAEDPHRGADLRAAGVRAGRGGVHRRSPCARGRDNAAFFSANSCQKPKFFGQSKEGKDAETNYKLGTQLPYMFIVNRLAHYIKVIQRENIGSWKERAISNRELNNWINQYVAEMDDASATVRGAAAAAGGRDHGRGRRGRSGLVQGRT